MIRFSAIHKQRLIIITALVLGIGMAIALTMYGLRQNINLFFMPTDVVQGDVPEGQVVRLGGLVAEDSIWRSSEDLSVQFYLTDTFHDVQVNYTGILPDLFREEQGIVVLGTLQPDQTFLAQQVLAKHDENYMPAEVFDRLQAMNVIEVDA